jgi:hypothetical protein
MKNIPLILPVFNQLTYLRNIINWWRWYYPENPIYIIDNGSTYASLINFYSNMNLQWKDITFIQCGKNEFISNLTKWLENLIKPKYQYYVISDVDIMPHPSTPPNFLEIFKNYIDNHKFHRVGFNLITEGLPQWLHEREMIIGNEAELCKTPVLEYQGHKGYKAPIDTTFCLYTTNNSGWQAPMNGEDWGNCLRLFEAFHSGWYIHGDHLNDEMKFYFENSKYRIPGEPSAGRNNNRPKQYQ